jgi:hypothetical protein
VAALSPLLVEGVLVRGMKPQLRQLPVADMADMDSWKVHDDALALAHGVDQTDDVFVSCEHVVDLGTERSSGELGDLPEVSSDLILPWVVAGDLGPPRDVKNEVVREESDVAIEVSRA